MLNRRGVLGGLIMASLASRVAALETEEGSRGLYVVSQYAGMRREDAFLVEFGGDGTPPPGARVVVIDPAMPDRDENNSPVVPYDWSKLTPAEYRQPLDMLLARKSGKV
jgi:hypothetical protein